MKHKADLQSVRALILAKKSLQRERLDLYHGKSGAGYANAGKPSKGMTPESSVERTFLHMEDQAAKLDWRIDSIKKVINHRLSEMLPVIQHIADKRYRDILMQRYVAAQPWKVIARNLNYERRYLMKLHYRALVAYERWASVLDKPDAFLEDQDAK